MSIKTMVFILVILFFAPIFTKGQVVQRNHYFSSIWHPDITYDMEFDAEGFLWLGNRKPVEPGDRPFGLMRFDGKHFHKIPLPDFGNANYTVTQIQKTQKGLFYLRSWGNAYQLLALDPYTLNFEAVPFEGFETSVWQISQTFKNQNKYYSIVQDSSGKTSLFELDSAQSHKITDISLPHGAAINQFTVFIPYKDCFLLYTNGLGVATFSWSGQQIHRFDSRGPYRRYGLVSFEGEGVFVKRKTPILYKYQEASKKMVPVFDLRKEVGGRDFWFWNDDKGQLLLSVAKEDQVLIYRITADKVQKIRQIEDLNIIKWPVFYAKDAMQSLWVGNQAHFLTRFYFQSGKIQQFLIGSKIETMYPLAENEVLVAMKNEGLKKINLKEGTTTDFPLWHNGKPFPMSNCRSLIPEKNQPYIWCNSGSRIVRINLKTHQVIYRNVGPVETLTRFNDSLLVFGSYKDDLMVFNTNTKKARVLLKQKSIWMKNIVVKGDTLYVGTSGGLLVYNFLTGKHQVYLTNLKGIERTINAMIYRPDFGLLLGTRTGKVFRFNPSDATVKLLYQVPKQASISGFLYYKKELWINTKNGFIAYEMATGKGNRYAAADIFIGNYTTRFSMLALKNGMLIGTNNGLNYFNPTEIEDGINYGHLVPLAIKAYNSHTKNIEKNRDRKQLRTQKRFILPADHRFFQLYFGMADGDGNARARFKYRLNGKDWVNLFEENAVRFDYLASGLSTLEIAAFDANGHQIGAPLKYELLTKQYFYKRGWFVALMVLLLLLGVGIIMSFYKQQKVIELEKKSSDQAKHAQKELEKKYEIGRDLYYEKEKNLKEKERELVAFALQIADLKNEINAILLSWDTDANISRFRSRLKKVLNREDEWDVFVKKFIGVYPEFSERIKTLYPQLTQNDLEFCMLLKLNLSNKEIAALLGINHQSVITKRYRIRKKIKLEGEVVSIEEWLAVF